MPALAALLLFQAATFGLPEADARLGPATKVEARIEPLPELLGRLGKGAGLVLTVERKMRTLKATAFVEGLPLRTVLRRLADVFDAEWVTTPNGYRLEMPTPHRNRLESYLKLEGEASRAQAEKQLRGWALAAAVPWVELAEVADQSTKARSAYKDTDAPGFWEVYDRSVAFNQAKDPQMYFLGRLVQSMGPEEFKRLWEGQALYASSRGRGVPKLPGDADWYRQDWKEKTLIIRPTNDILASGEAPGPVRVFLKYDPELETLASAYHASRTSMVYRPVYGLNPGRNPRKAEHSFLKAQNEWAFRLAEPTYPEADLPLRTLEAKTQWSPLGFTSVDHLEQLHRESGLPIIAEGFRVLSQKSSIGWGTGTLNQALQRWEEGSVRITEGVIMVRPSSFWISRANEPPEDAIRRWESLKNPGLDDDAALSLALDRRQSAAIFGKAVRSHASLESLVDAAPFLQVWGSSSAEQRATIRAERPVALAAMGQAARRAAIDTLIDGIFVTGIPGERMLSLFDAPFDPARLGEIALWSETEGIATVGRSAGPFVRGQMNSTPRQAGVRFTIGPEPGVGMTFTVARGEE